LTEKGHFDFIAKSRVAVVAFLGDSDSEKRRQMFDAVAQKWRAHYSLGYVYGLAEGHQNPSIAIFKQDEEDVAYYFDEFTPDGIEHYLQTAAKFLIPEYGPAVQQHAFKVGCALKCITWEAET
jgi:protein disulfide-isomerase A1